MLARAVLKSGCRERNFSNRTSLTVWVTRGLLTICKVPPPSWTFLANCTKTPRPELSINSIFERSRIKCLGPSSMHLVKTFRKTGSEKASIKPVRRNSCKLSLISRVPRKLTVRESGSEMLASCGEISTENLKLQYRQSQAPCLSPPPPGLGQDNPPNPEKTRKGLGQSLQSLQSLG